MATYNTIETAAFVAVPGAGPSVEPYYTFTFPAHWRQAIVDLDRHGREGAGDKWEVPIRSLNGAIRALAPDLVSVANNATRDDDQPWLYTSREYPASVVKPLITSWLQTRVMKRRGRGPQPPADTYQRLAETIEMMELDELDWDLQSVELTRQTLTEGSTANPDQYVYRLLPDVLAARIEARCERQPYEYCDREVRFRRVATKQGAELMSWEPSTHVPIRKRKTLDPWHYSGTIKITVHTVPFSPIMRVHVAVGIRRWVRGEVWPADGDDTTVYLFTEGPWLSGGTPSVRFAAAPLIVRRHGDEVKADWAYSGPADIMSRLSIARSFPKPGDLAQDAEAWLDGRDGVNAAVTHHSAMGYHGVHTGIMAGERQRLMRWVAEAFAPDFEPAAAMTRPRGMKLSPKALLQRHASVPKKDATQEQIDEAHARNAEIDNVNAGLRRQYLARAVGGDHVLSCHLLYQTAEVRDALIDAAVRSLALDEHHVPCPDGTWAWRTPELEVRIHAQGLKEHGGPLGGDNPPRRGKEMQEAIGQRRRAVKAFLEEKGEDSQVVFVELEGKEKFKRRTTDPKFAIRLGCADAGRVSQFITPNREEDGDEAESEENASSLKHRADFAWADGLRQVGMSLVPQHTLRPGAIPDNLNQVAFWLVRRNIDSPTRNSQFTPIAILIRPGQDQIMGRTPGLETWVPYPELLKQLAGQTRGPESQSAKMQAAETARFIRQALSSLQRVPTVVLVYAQNARSRWEWLLNGQLIADKIKLGDYPAQNLALSGKSLRLIRVRDGERDETPEWWAPDENGHAGYSKGLWAPAGVGDDNRVFYGTAEKGGTHKDALRDDTKLTPHINEKSGKQVTNAGKNAWNPTLLEIIVAGCTPQDKPAEWAMYVHQQRFPDDYRDGLKLPLVLHLAELATEYALPHELTELIDEDEDATPDEADEGEE
jgi:hypothetical protein